MDQKLEPVRLDSLAGGAAMEFFDHELAKVIKNIQDPNTSPTEKRKITMEISLSPTQDREMGSVDVSCKSKLSGVKPISSTVFLGLDAGKPVAYQKDPKQPEFPWDSNVTPMKGVEGDKGSN